jgi:hypothetical protein
MIAIISKFDEEDHEVNVSIGITSTEDDLVYEIMCILKTFSKKHPKELLKALDMLTEDD